MTSLALLTAAPVPLRLAAGTFLMTPLTLRDYGEIEQVMRAERAVQPTSAGEGDTATATADGDALVAPPVISAAEMAAWMCGAGLAYVLWQVLRKRHKELTLDDCRKFVAEEPDVAALAWQLDLASGLPPGNARRQARAGRRGPTSLAACAALIGKQPFRNFRLPTAGTLSRLLN
ncbi:MAG TPA: hypothetical protein VHD36_08515 [Pirellulales bacterium]|nr:hypothetical protein [Pirellulales bacterium]